MNARDPAVDAALANGSVHRTHDRGKGRGWYLAEQALKADAKRRMLSSDINPIDVEVVRLKLFESKSWAEVGKAMSMDPGSARRCWRRFWRFA